jgi:hypothetical protein
MVYYLRTRAKKPNQCDRFIVCIKEQSAAQANVVSTKWSEMPTMSSTGNIDQVGKLDQREGASVEHGQTVGEVGNSNDRRTALVF